MPTFVVLRHPETILVTDFMNPNNFDIFLLDYRLDYRLGSPQWLLAIAFLLPAFFKCNRRCLCDVQSEMIRLVKIRGAF